MHPQPEPVRFAVRLDGWEIPVGENNSPQAARKVPPARAALAAAVADGWFVREERAWFVFARHYSDVDALLTYYRERDPEATLDDRIIARARELLAEGDGTIVSRAHIHAERLRRSEPHGSGDGRER